MKWYKFSMTFGAGHHEYAETYEVFNDKDTKEDIENTCRDWAEENSYTTHFVCKFKKIKNPPKKFIENKIEEYTKLNNLYSSLASVYKKYLEDIK